MKSINPISAALIFTITLLLSCNNSQKKSYEELEAELEFETMALLGEGAFWNHKTQELYWVDIEDKKFNIYNPSSVSNRIIQMPSLIGTVVPYNENEAVVALLDGVYKVDLLTEEISLLSDVESNIPENRFNDGKCDPNGNLWVGSMHFEQSKPNASVYRINEQGETVKMIDSVTISNGIVWTKDAKTMYYIDTPAGNIMGYDYNDQTSTISNGRIAVKVSEEDGFPDGMAIDENDMLWVGMWNGNAVAQYDPKKGKLVSKISVPAHNVTSCAFGGENLDILYITTSSLDMTEEEQNRFPMAGSIFMVKPGVTGVESRFFGN
ncbi:MAG: SMP-30/gluconolactonase/LRE family protein [Flavobacteriaceae bacterium]|nr:SMP-30/gluconolactonase/LRE family protein [Flavobacteriaceae bacterium]